MTMLRIYRVEFERRLDEPGARWQAYYLNAVKVAAASVAEALHVAEAPGRDAGMRYQARAVTLLAETDQDSTEAL